MAWLFTLGLGYTLKLASGLAVVSAAYLMIGTGLANTTLAGAANTEAFR